MFKKIILIITTISSFCCYTADALDGHSLPGATNTPPCYSQQITTTIINNVNLPQGAQLGVVLYRHRHHHHSLVQVDNFWVNGGDDWNLDLRKYNNSYFRTNSVNILGTNQAFSIVAQTATAQETCENPNWDYVVFYYPYGFSNAFDITLGATEVGYVHVDVHNTQPSQQSNFGGWVKADVSGDETNKTVTLTGSLPNPA